MEKGVMSIAEFSRLSRDNKETAFKQLKHVTKYTFPSKMLERDIEDRIGNLTTPMLNKYYSQMLTRM